MKRILIVEDNQGKLQKIRSFLQDQYPDYEVFDQQSYNSAKKEIILNYKSYDLILLDMSMQTYNISDNETGGEPEPLAGKKILNEMYLNDINIKVLVITMFESFVGIKTAELDYSLTEEFGDIYCGYVFFSHSNNDWQSNLKQKLKNLL